MIIYDFGALLSVGRKLELYLESREPHFCTTVVFRRIPPTPISGDPIPHSFPSLPSISRVEIPPVQHDQQNPSPLNHYLLQPDEGEVSMDLATPLIPTSPIAALSSSRSQAPSRISMGYNDDDDMHSPSPRVDDNPNFEFEDPPSYPPLCCLQLVI